MGAELKREQKQMVIANINFSGFKHAPFQFYSQEHYIEQQQLNTIFKKQLKKYHKQNGSERAIQNKLSEQNMKAVAKIDKHIKTQRYSPLYVKSCGVYDGKLINKQQFQFQWWSVLKSNMGWKKLKHKQKDPYKYQDFDIFKEDYKQQLLGLLDFDYLIYSTILIYVYDNDQVQNIINQRSCSKYLGFIDVFFNKSCLNSQRKTITVLKFLQKNNIDILFMQEATDNFCNELQRRSRQYRFIKSRVDQYDPGYSLVVFREASFKHANVGRKGNLKLLRIIQDKRMDQQAKKDFLNWGKTAVISIDNFILISAESSLTKQRIIKDLRLIKQKLPTKYIVIGATFHRGIDVDGLDYYCFPINKLTNYKKRTYMQLQQQKSNQFIAYQNSYIISDKRLNKSQKCQFDKVVTANMQTIDHKALPSPNHEKKDKSNMKSQQLKEYEKKQKQAKAKNKQSQKDYSQKLSNVLGLIPNQEHIFEELILLKTIILPTKINKYQNLTPEQLKIKKEQKQRLNLETSSSQQQGNQTKS